MTSASTTAPTHESISQLLEHSAYNPGIVPQLEAYVDAQIEALTKGVPEQAPYLFDANRTLLKHYQFFPHIVKEGYIALVLFLSLTEFPSTDCFALSCLIPEKIQSREPCSTLISCSDLLEKCQFTRFWPLLKQLPESPSTLSPAATSPTSLSKFRWSILRLLSLTYSTAPLAVVLSAMELESSYALKDFLDERGNESAATIVSEIVETELCVNFIASAENSKQSRVFKAGVHFDAIASIIAQAKE